MLPWRHVFNWQPKSVRPGLVICLPWASRYVQHIPSSSQAGSHYPHEQELAKRQLNILLNCQGEEAKKKHNNNPRTQGYRVRGIQKKEHLQQWPHYIVTTIHYKMASRTKGQDKGHCRKVMKSVATHLTWRIRRVGLSTKTNFFPLLAYRFCIYLCLCWILLFK